MTHTQTAISIFFFFQAEDGIRDKLVNGVQTCALPISRGRSPDVWSWRATGHEAISFFTRLPGTRQPFCRRPSYQLPRSRRYARERRASDTSAARSEERRGGEEGRSRWAPDQ